MKKKKVIIGVVGILLIISIFTLGSINKNKNKSIAVKTAEVLKGDLKSYLSTTGVVKSQNYKEYYASQSKVNKINVKVGDKVKKGDTLITFELQDLNTPVKQAEIQYNNAILQNQELINQRNDQNEKIADKNTEIENLSKQIIDIDNKIKELQNQSTQIGETQIQTLKQQKSTKEQQKTTLIQQRDSIQGISSEKLKQSNNAITSAKLNIDAAKANLSKGVSSIIASNEGIVTSINITEGAMANSAQPAIIVQNLENLKVVLSVGKYDVNNVKLNQKALIKSGNKEYKGNVNYIAPAAEKSKDALNSDTTLSVEVNIVDKNPELKIDFDVDIDILLQEAKGIIKIPGEAVKTNKNGKSFVYIVEENKAIEKEIKIGVQSDTEVQILEGVKSGEKIIINPTDAVKNGTLVKVSELNSEKQGEK